MLAFNDLIQAPGIVFNSRQTDVLNDFLRISTPINVSAYKDSFRTSFPVNEKSEDILKVSSDLTTFLRLFTLKAVFNRSESLFIPHLKEIEKTAFHEQTAFRMSIVITLYMQQALATLLTELDIENTNLDKATQTVGDLFAMSTKVLDQFGRSDAYGHFICRKATMIDIGLDPAK